jgi:hypothetical protein
MAGAVTHGTAAGLAHMLREGTSLHPCDDLVLTIWAAHAAGRSQGDEAALGTGSANTVGGGSLEIYSAALAATDGAGWGNVRRAVLTGGQETGNAKTADHQECFHQCFHMW